MKNIESWRPTKFVIERDKWVPSHDPAELAPPSRHTSGQALRAYVAAIENFASGRLLDLGSGKAPLFGAYRAHVSDVTCVDWPGSPHDTMHVDIFADLNEPLDLGSEEYDTILSTSVLEHIWAHETLWDEMVRVLRPGGHIILGTPFMYWLHEQPHDYFRWTNHALRRAAVQRGLDVIDVAAFGTGMDVLCDVAAKLAHAKNRRLGRVVAKAATWLMSRRSVRTFSDTKAANMPLGYVIVARKPEPSPTS